MDAVTLARIQFAFTVAYHFMIVPLSIGLSVIMVAAERRYRRTGAAADRAAADFWIKLFTTCFALGVATGVTMEFAFGTNWAAYSRFVGDIFGAPLAAEGVFAFFLESTFLGVLLFGRARVSERFYYVSAWLVAAGAHLSALWIIIANSWQQTPAGFKVENGRAILTDFFAAAFNPSTVVRYLHTVASTWVVGGFIAAGIAAWYLLKGKETEFAKRVMPIGLIVALLASLAMPIIGDSHAKQVAVTQPAKMAAFEGLYKTTDNPGMTLFGFTDDANKTVVGRIELPGVLGFLVGQGPNKTVKGLDAFGADIPPVQLTFQSYHLMVALGMLLVLIAGVALIQERRGKLAGSRWLLWALVWSAPLALLAIQSGWTAAEVGRQPWIVYGQLRTLDAVSAVVSAGQILATLLGFVVIYALLAVGFSRIFFRVIARGPSALRAAESTASAPSPSATGAR